jgi:DNA ligase (NAD+)
VIEWVAESLSALLLVAVLGGAYAVDRLSEEPSDAERARRAYEEGRINEDELERRLDVALDPEVDRIREALEPINGVGPATSLTIAQEVDSLEALERATAEDLEEIHGVGPSTASAIKERLS